MKENVRKLLKPLFGSDVSTPVPEIFQLILDAFIRENASGLREWAAEIPDIQAASIHSDFPAPNTGIGVLTVKENPDNKEIQNITSEAEKHVNLILRKTGKLDDLLCEPDDSYFSAVTGNEKDSTSVVSKFLAFQAVMLSLAGISELFVHCFPGHENFKESLSVTGINMADDGGNIDYKLLEKELSDPDSQKSRILSMYSKMLDAKGKEPAFNPEGMQIVPEASGPVFAVLRVSPDGKEKVLCLINISRRIVKCFAYWDFLSAYNKSKLYDIITEKESGSLVIYNDSGKSDTGSECSAMVTLDPWEVLWLK